MSIPFCCVLQNENPNEHVLTCVKTPFILRHSHLLSRPSPIQIPAKPPHPYTHFPLSHPHPPPTHTSPPQPHPRPLHLFTRTPPPNPKLEMSILFCCVLQNENPNEHVLTCVKTPFILWHSPLLSRPSPIQIPANPPHPYTHFPLSHPTPLPHTHLPHNPILAPFIFLLEPPPPQKEKRKI